MSNSRLDALIDRLVRGESLTSTERDLLAFAAVSGIRPGVGVEAVNDTRRRVAADLRRECRRLSRLGWKVSAIAAQLQVNERTLKRHLSSTRG